MSKNDSSYERLLTVSLPEELHVELQHYAQRFEFANFSALIRFALESFDAKKHLTTPESSRQVSFRIPDDLRASLDKQAKKAGVSLGHLIRTALERRPEKPAAPAAKPKSKTAGKATRSATTKSVAKKQAAAAKPKSAKPAAKKKAAPKSTAKKTAAKGRK